MFGDGFPPKDCQHAKDFVSKNERLAREALNRFTLHPLRSSPTLRVGIGQQQTRVLSCDGAHLELSKRYSSELSVGARPGLSIERRAGARRQMQACRLIRAQ